MGGGRYLGGEGVGRQVGGWVDEGRKEGGYVGWLVGR